MKPNTKNMNQSITFMNPFIKNITKSDDEVVCIALQLSYLSNTMTRKENKKRC